MRALPLTLILCALPTLAADPLLQYHLSGLEGESLQNAQAYLGPPPDTEDERNNFVYSARQDVQFSLNALGYYQPDIALNLDKTQKIWSLEINVKPGPRTHLQEVDVAISGEAAEDKAFHSLLKQNPLQVGAGLHHGDYDSFKAQLQSLGNERGYFEASLAKHQMDIDSQESQARVVLHYNSGERFNFGAVQFDEFPLNHRILSQLLPFEEGEPFDVVKLQKLQSDLQETGYFGSALVQPQTPDPNSQLVPVHVSLQPGDINHYRVGLGFSTDTGERISFTWRTPLLNRRGHWQETRVEYSPIRPRANFTYGIPLSHPLNDQLLLGARLENNEYGSIDSWQQELSARREWKLGKWITSARVRYLKEDWELGFEELQNEYLLPGVSVSHTTSRGNRLDPDAGFSQLYGLESGADQAGSDLDLARIYANLQGVITLAPRHRLVGRAELGAVFFDDEERRDLAPSLSFFTGGTDTIRGYSYLSLGPTETITGPDGNKRKVVVGGDRLAVASAEYQYYVTPEWRGAVFIDGGNAYNAGDFDAVVGAGFGIHYVSPVGAIRIDLANSVSEDDPSWRIHISLGAEF